MKRIAYVYGGAFVIAVRRTLKRALRDSGEYLKRLGRKFVLLGEDSTPRWRIELFHRCYLSDAEFHFGFDVFRGPMYAAFSTGDALSFRLNWLAKKDEHGEWDYAHGAGLLSFKLKDYSPPYQLPNGDIWFTFDGGYAVLYLGTPRETLEFKGPPYTLRTFTYF